MKKIIFLLLITVSANSQALFDKGIKNTGAKNDSNPVYVVTQNIGNVYGRISAARIAKDTVLDTNFKVIKTTTKTIQESFSKADEALFKARGTELSEGGIPSINTDPTKFNITPAVLGQIKNGTDYYAISYSGASAIPVTNIASLNTWVYLDNNGALQQQTTAPTRTDYYAKLFLARFASNGTQLIAFERLRNPSGQYSNSIRELYDYIVSANVPLKQGLDITGNANLTFNRSAGSVFKFGAGNDSTPNTPSFSSVSPASFFLVDRASVAGSQFTNVPVTQYDNGGALTTIANNKFVAHRVYFFTSGNLAMQYGQTEFSTLDAAKSGAPSAKYVTNPVNVNGTFLGWWVVGKNATDLTNPLTSYFMPYTIGSGAGGTASGALLASNNLSDLNDASIARTNLGSENVTNKQNSLTADGTNTKYPTVTAVIVGLAGKQNTITNPITGSLTTNTIPKATGSTTLGNSKLVDDGTGLITFLSNQSASTEFRLQNNNPTIGGGTKLSFNYNGTETGYFQNTFDGNSFTTTLIGTTGARIGSNAFKNSLVTSQGGKVLINKTVDNGNQNLQIEGSALVSGLATVDALAITTTPTTSTGTPPLLTYNATTKAVESVPYSTFSTVSGNYTPTFTSLNNGATAIAFGISSYTRVGNVVTATIGFEVNFTAANTNSSFSITLPINRASISSYNVGSGVGSLNIGGTDNIIAFRTQSNSTTTVNVSFYPKFLVSGNGSVTIMYNVNN
jgi:hypothetical protein